MKKKKKERRGEFFITLLLRKYVKSIMVRLYEVKGVFKSLIIFSREAFPVLSNLGIVNTIIMIYTFVPDLGRGSVCSQTQWNDRNDTLPLHPASY